MSNEFISEVNQELHDERLVRLWNRFGRYIIGGSILIILSTAGVTGYNAYKNYVAKNEALLFEQYVTNNNQEGIGKLASSGNNGSKIMSVTALADAYVGSGEFEKAEKTLLNYADSAGEEIYKQYATLASVWVMMKRKVNKNMLTTLDTVIDSGYYVGLAQFTKVEVLLGIGDKEQAKNILLKLAFDKSLTSEQRGVAKIAFSTLADQ